MQEFRRLLEFTWERRAGRHFSLSMHREPFQVQESCSTLQAPNSAPRPEILLQGTERGRTRAEPWCPPLRRGVGSPT